MPISIDEFDAGDDGVLEFGEGTQPRQILAFLAEHPDEAFTQSEISEQTGITRGSVGGVLSRLEDRGLVRHKGRYWSIGDDDRIAAFAAQIQASAESVDDGGYYE